MTIRRTPQDFRVEERPARGLLDRLVARCSARAPYAVYRLTKTSLTTPEGESRLAKSLGVHVRDVQHAGLKDKHAVTTQMVSVRGTRDDPAGGLVAPDGPLLGEAPAGWSAELLGWSMEPASAAWIDCNEFTIVVRDLTREDCERMDHRASLLRLGGEAPGEAATLPFVNYFGDQRFGSARHGKGFVARHLVRGEFEAALRLAIGTPARKDQGKKRSFTRLLAAGWGEWAKLAEVLPRCPERASVECLARGGSFLQAFGALPYFTQRLCVEAYQSYLWNGIAAGIVEERAEHEMWGDGEVVRADDDFGAMVFPHAARVSEEEGERVLPMPGPETIVPAWADRAYEGVLRKEGLTLDQLRIPGLRRPSFDAFGRPLFTRAEEFSMSAPESDELSRGGKRLKRTLRFALGSGSYATVLLRALGQ